MIVKSFLKAALWCLPIFLGIVIGIIGVKSTLNFIEPEVTEPKETAEKIVEKTVEKIVEKEVEEKFQHVMYIAVYYTGDTIEIKDPINPPFKDKIEYIVTIKYTIDYKCFSLIEVNLLSDKDDFLYHFTVRIPGRCKITNEHFVIDIPPRPKANDDEGF